MAIAKKGLRTAFRKSRRNPGFCSSQEFRTTYSRSLLLHGDDLVVRKHADLSLTFTS